MDVTAGVMHLLHNNPLGEGLSKADNGWEKWRHNGYENFDVEKQKLTRNGSSHLEHRLMVDSKFSEYGMACNETGLPKHDMQMAVPVAAKKIALDDLQNQIIMVPKSVGSSFSSKESAPSIEQVKVAGTERPDCSVSSPHQQFPTSNSANGHLVYVRRKPEAELGKSSTCDKTSNYAGCPQPADDSIPQKPQMNDSKVCMAEDAAISRASSECFSPKELSVPLPLGKSTNTSPPADSNYLRVSSSINSLEERSRRLQNLLELLDQSDQDEYVQMLRSLSSVELSRHAVELEKRSIQLSLEEGHEQCERPVNMTMIKIKL
ncbi:hypothetical protein RJ639_046602 [Escallonia herrerae]|uniref:Uncharacterized protein n=1 Tax=Escallonia herrerae TaxID=1293975 RepID=A0AA88W4E9_9ASTE|nr:hypothetical protein RJ639_046602 [Escallonia herrerae]